MDPHSFHRRCRAVLSAPIGRNLPFGRAAGCWVHDLEGKAYLDFTAGFGVASAGWQHPELVAVLQQQAERAACFAPPWQPTLEAVELAEALLPLVPARLKKCLRANGGGDANEHALRAVSLLRPGATACFSMAYHGGTRFARMLGRSRPAGGDLGAVRRIEPPYCYRCPYGQTFPACDLACAAAVEDLLACDPGITSIIVEPVIGSGGVVVPPSDYFRRLRRTCDAHGVLLIFDEVLTGFGRLGTPFAADLYGVEPDAMTLGKALGGGCVSIGAALLSASLAAAVERDDDVTGTFAWTPLACRVARATVELFVRERLAARAAELGPLLRAELTRLLQRYLPDRLGEVRGQGMLIGIELVSDPERRQFVPRFNLRLALTAQRHGLLIAASWDMRYLIIVPPLTIEREQVAEGLNRFESTLREVSR